MVHNFSLVALQCHFTRSHVFTVPRFFLNQSTFASKCDPAFVSVGFRNWKKAIQKFSKHAKSQLHIIIIIINQSVSHTHQGNNKIYNTRQSQEPREPISLSFKIDLNFPKDTRSANFKSFCTSFQAEGAENLKAFLPSSVLALGTCICIMFCECRP